MRSTLRLTSAICLMTGGAMAAKSADYPYQPVPFTSVKVKGGFWGPRFETNRQVTVWYDFKKCEETGRIANFARAGGLEQGPFQGIPFNDSDVFKVMEGAAYLLAQEIVESIPVQLLPSCLAESKPPHLSVVVLNSLRERLDLPQDRGRIQHHTGCDQVPDVRVENPAGDMVQLVLIRADHHCVARVGSALITHHEVEC